MRILPKPDHMTKMILWNLGIILIVTLVSYPEPGTHSPSQAAESAWLTLHLGLGKHTWPLITLRLLDVTCSKKELRSFISGDS